MIESEPQLVPQDERFHRVRESARFIARQRYKILSAGGAGGGVSAGVATGRADLIIPIVGTLIALGGIVLAINVRNKEVKENEENRE